MPASLCARCCLYVKEKNSLRQAWIQHALRLMFVACACRKRSELGMGLESACFEEGWGFYLNLRGLTCPTTLHASVSKDTLLQREGQSCFRPKACTYIICFQTRMTFQSILDLPLADIMRLCSFIADRFRLGFVNFSTQTVCKAFCLFLFFRNWWASSSGAKLLHFANALVGMCLACLKDGSCRISSTSFVALKSGMHTWQTISALAQ